ncbi:family 43 glycosylhydrolase [Bifidobacterium sp. ESL0704]|uniref:family 43 glycosylhydrolase n=1 Tax=Bifidobacterium sp. ESL0704 TaxID=2983219 RepID=UPI0023FA1952|nr:family 43 glycosylhydrolase [Bifidobacterium sp. ESL0704]WEV53324.1 family 43 glycosylhydrolase [Bifidobacterium sp. ESL0704]
MGFMIATATIAAFVAPIPAALAQPAIQATTQSSISTLKSTKPKVEAPDSYRTITNDRFYTDTDGNKIFSQGGGIFDFTDPKTGKAMHYWYGVHYQEAETYAANPIAPSANNHFKSIDVYSSTDLVNWKNEGVALDYGQANAFSSQFGNRDVGWVGRMGVAYVKDLNRYALLVQHEMPTDNTGKNFDKEVLIATSDSPTGPFTADRRISMKDYGLGTTNTGDQSVFQDDDGTGYLVYSYGKGRISMWVARIGAKDGKLDLLNPTKIYQGQGREGNTMFKADGRYYAAASDLFGWDSSRIHYLVSDNITGPYTPTNSMNIMDGSNQDFAHITQTGFYYTVHGTKQDTVIHMGDRWADFAGNGLGYNQWNPVTIDEDGTPHFVSMNQWQLNAATGQWKVGAQNDYVLNGGFEADRVKVGPNGYKDKDGKTIPDLAGWTRTNPAAVYNDNDKANRVGDYNLEFKSAQAYQAKIEQTIAPTSFQLPDGDYTLSAVHMSVRDLADAKLYADSGSNHYEADLAATTKGKWKEASTNVTVSGGSVKVGVAVNGAAGDLLRVDDISLKRVSDAPAADRTNLDKLMTKAKQLKEPQYTNDSWTKFQTALANATAVFNNAEASQDDIDNAETALQTAIDALVKNPEYVDTTKLEKALTDASAKAQADYTTISWKLFTDAKTDAQQVLDNAQATQQQVDDATSALTDAMNALKPLNLESNPGFESGQLDGGWVTNPANVSPVRVKNENAHTGKYSWNSWSNKAQDYTLSQTVMASAGLYSFSTWVEGNRNPNAKLSLSLKSGDTILATTPIELDADSIWKKVTVTGTLHATPTQSGDDTLPLTTVLSVQAPAGAWFAFDDFMLQSLSDKTLLLRQIAAATALNQADYTPESWTAMQTALTTARSVNADDNATQETVDNATKGLQTAIENLKKVGPTTPPAEGTKPGDSNPGDGNSNGNGSTGNNGSSDNGSTGNNGSSDNGKPAGDNGFTGNKPEGKQPSNATHAPKKNHAKSKNATKHAGYGTAVLAGTGSSVTSMVITAIVLFVIAMPSMLETALKLKKKDKR